MKIERVVCGLYAANAYIINDELLIDPGDDAAALMKALPQPKAILLTHGHFDHMLAAETIQQKTDAPVYVHPEDAAMLTDAGLSVYNKAASTLPQPENVETIDYPEELFGFKVLHTPGHSEGSVCLYNEAEGVLISGDTLFRAGYGRYDLPGGNVNKLVGSLNRLLALPEDTKVYPGHGEMTTIGDERRRYGR